MIQIERRAILSNELRHRGMVSIAAMTKRIGVSEVTLRRDLDELARTGLAVRVRGGARLNEEVPLPDASQVTPRLPDQDELAGRVASLVRPGQVVGLTGHRFAPAIARALLTIQDVGIVSNSLAVIDVLREHGTARAVLVGGVLTENGCLAGPMAVGALARLHLDSLFFEGDGLDPAAGVTIRNLLEAEVTRALLRAANSVFVAGAPDQWRHVNLTTVADLDAVDALLTMSGQHLDWSTHFKQVV